MSNDSVKMYRRLFSMSAEDATVITGDFLTKTSSGSFIATFNRDDFIKNGEVVFETLGNLCGFFGSDICPGSFYFDFLKGVIAHFQINSDELRGLWQVRTRGSRRSVCGHSAIRFGRRDVVQYLIKEHGFTTADFCGVTSRVMGGAAANAAAKAAANAAIFDQKAFINAFETDRSLLVLDLIVENISFSSARIAMFKLISEVADVLMAGSAVTGSADPATDPVATVTVEVYRNLYEHRFGEIYRTMVCSSIAAEMVQVAISRAIGCA